MPEIFTMAEAAEALGISRFTLKYHLRQGGFFEGFGRIMGRTRVFTLAEVEAMCEKKKAMPPPGQAVSVLDGERRGKLAYEIHNLEGLSWAKIAERLGYTSESGAWRAAKRYEHSLQPKAKKKAK